MGLIGEAIHGRAEPGWGSVDPGIEEFCRALRNALTPNRHRRGSGRSQH